MDTVLDKDEALKWNNDEPDIWNCRRRELTVERVSLLENGGVAEFVSVLTLRRCGVVTLKALEKAELEGDEPALLALYIEKVDGELAKELVDEAFIETIDPDDQARILEIGEEINRPLLAAFRKRKAVREERILKASGYDREAMNRKLLKEVLAELGHVKPEAGDETSTSSSEPDTTKPTS